MHQTDQHAQSSPGTHHAQHAASSASESTMTALSLGRLGSRPDDIVMHVDWERRTTTVTLSYHHGRNRAPQHIVFPALALPNQNDIAAEASNITVPPTYNVNTVNNDAAAQTTLGLSQTPNRNASPCARGCQERGAPASSPSTSRRDRIPVPQLDLPAPDRRLGDIGLSDFGIAVATTTATAPTSTSRPIPPLPRRNRQTGPTATATATSSAAAAPPRPPTIPRPPPSTAAPPSNSPIQSPDAPATPSTSSRPVTPTPNGSSSSQVKAEKSSSKKDKNPSAGDDTSRPGLSRKRSKTLRPYRHSHKIRSTKLYTTWYGPTESTCALPAPPDILSPCHAFLYVHRHTRGTQVWMFHGARRTATLSPTASWASWQGEDQPSDVGAGPDGGAGAAREKGKGRWKTVYPGFPHPDLAGYVLHLLDDGQPRWVKEASAKTYAGGQRRRQRMARYM